MPQNSSPHCCRCPLEYLLPGSSGLSVQLHSNTISNCSPCMNPFSHRVQAAGGSCYRGRCCSTALPITTGRHSLLLWRALRASLPLSIAACMASPAASAASSARAPKQAPQAVHAILQYLCNHPMTVTSLLSEIW